MHLQLRSLRQSARVRLGAAALAAVSLVSMCVGDVVTDWNATLETAHRNLTPSPGVQMRNNAIVHAAIFDAVNGIAKQYAPLCVTQAAPTGASAEAAAMQAAYTSLLSLVPAKRPMLDAQLARSLAQISGERGADQSITLGREWGEKVAQQILAWRTQDGTSKTPTYEGSTAAGYWRHAPNANAVPAGASIPVPFVLSNLSAFDPGPPYGIADRAAAMATAAYAADVNESKARGGAVSTARTAAQTDMAVFIDISDVTDVNAAVRRSIPASASLVENARTFALVNIAAWDAGIVLSITKYKYGLWRPDQAIPFADKDGNSATTADPTWRPLRCTPSHPEYLSAHVLVYTVMTATAAALLGKDTPITFTTSNPNAPAVRAFTRFSEISDATVEGRVDVGFHFRSCCTLSQKVGYTIADAIVATGLRPTKASERTTVSVSSPTPSVGEP